MKERKTSAAKIKTEAVTLRAVPSDKSDRLAVLKTYKLYVNGAFPRTESGRFYALKDNSGTVIANVCLSSRKDLRDAVTAARAAFTSWAGRSAYNRGQIIYRIAEMLESRAESFVSELLQMGLVRKAALAEVQAAVDRLVYYAGWSDKYQQIFSSVNPVASSHFNFSVPEPMGVIGVTAPEESPLLGFVSVVAPAIVGGNTVVALASESSPLSAVSFGEVLHSSDVPAGVVNILTGTRSELLGHLSSHMDINAVVYTGEDSKERLLVDQNAALNVKRVISVDDIENQGPYQILDLQEIKTTWHPVGK